MNNLQLLFDNKYAFHMFIVEHIVGALLCYGALWFAYARRKMRHISISWRLFAVYPARVFALYVFTGIIFSLVFMLFGGPKGRNLLMTLSVYLIPALGLVSSEPYVLRAVAPKYFADPPQQA